MSIPISSSQIANCLATFLLRRLTSFTEIVAYYLGQTLPVEPTSEQPQALHQNQNQFSIDSDCNKAGFTRSQCDSEPIDSGPYRNADRPFPTSENKGPSRLRILDVDHQTLSERPVCWPQEKCVQVDHKRCSSDSSVQTEGCSTGSSQSVDSQLTDWCRWPVCTVHRLGGHCPLGEDHCPDAHVGRDLLAQIDNNGLVRICFESLGVGIKPCIRPSGCCRFFHPPEHIRMLLIRRRHAATASTTTKRHQRKTISLDGFPYLSSIPVRDISKSTVNPPTIPQDCVLTETDAYAVEAIRLLSGLMDYGQLLRMCAALMNPNQGSLSELPPTEVKHGTLKVAANVINRQLAAYSSLTDALQVQLAVAASDP